MRTLDDHLTGAYLRMFQHFGHGENRATRKTSLFQNRQPFVTGLLGKYLLQDSVQLVVILDTFWICGKFFVCLQILTFEQVTKLLPEAVITDCEVEIPVTCLECLVGHDRRMLVAFAVRRFARAEINASLVREK